ncbi:AcrZ family multidrug efflux pump-associated protein [Photorhabdus sp. CRCIA-P01]|nr:AcrZ family multidrug efflux pump-associated protein [Photorhabdus sp. CRCIA-P01]
MFELIKSMAFALVMVPVVMAGILGLIYGLGELFNIVSRIGRSEK